MDPFYALESESHTTGSHERSEESHVVLEQSSVH